MSIRTALFVSSLALTAVVAGVIYAATDEGWRHHQSGYYDQALGRASSQTVKDAIRATGLEIKQDRLAGFGSETRIDRCRTCHMAVDDPSFADGKEPLRTHPPTKGHASNEFGCTICHEGRGRALDKAEAHGDDPHCLDPVAVSPYIEASCARCHPEPYLDEMPHVRRGRRLFEQYACVGCHTVRGVSRGTLGPDLSDVGSRWPIAYLRESILVPTANAPLTQMPKFAMPDEDVVDLVVFLKSRRGRTLVEDPITLRTRTREWKEQRPPESAETVEAGAEAVRRRACVACHKLGDEDGGLAPDLSLVGAIRDAAYVDRHLGDPRRDTPDSNMPSFWIAPSERRAIAAFLTARPVPTVPAEPEAQYKALCVRCHGEKGDGEGPAAHNLVPRPRQFTNSRFFDWIAPDRAWKAIREGVPGTAMPAFGKFLDDAQAKALFEWLKTRFHDETRPVPPAARKLPERNPVAWSEARVEATRAVFRQRCYGCHGLLGDGKGPNAPDMLPRPRNLTNTAYFARVDDLRIFESITYGVVGTGMPSWDFLPEDQRWDLVNFVRALSRTGAAAGGSKK
ncbi:MAG: c-type cytochrome [Planctomycetes bacterium]|nr:c-type cytochrome [Planctomycetota bacterium]